MTRGLLVLTAGLLLLLADAVAQPAPPRPAKPCEPTLSNPCRPPALGSTVGPATTQPRERTRIDDSPIQDMQLDRDTAIGIGRGGGILGLERKFDPRN